jgi:hypothetical protein
MQNMHINLQVKAKKMCQENLRATEIKQAELQNEVTMETDYLIHKVQNLDK